MAQSSHHIAQLILMQLTGSLTPEEQVILRDWRAASPDNERWYQQFLSSEYMEAELIKFQQAEAFAATLAAPEITSASSASVPLLRRWWAAASIILVLGIGAYLWTTYLHKTETSVITQTMEDAAPGSDGAILTLADGRQVVLDSLHNGVIASQNGSDVVLNNGLLAYDLTEESTEAVEYNTITTPYGRQFSATLPDGTRIWLNAGSSIQYPTVFNKKERRVVVTGEVYMEVAPDKSKPFLVKTGQTTIQVLGTSFNVNAYPEEEYVSTTLVTGSVRVNAYNQLQTLLPGQQLQVNHSGSLTLVKNMNVESEIAWKNGVFHFNRARIAAVMIELARWYDVEIVYDKNIPDVSIIGEMKRNLTLHQILELLKEMGVKCQLNGRRIIVYE